MHHTHDAEPATLAEPIIQRDWLTEWLLEAGIRVPELTARDLRDGGIYVSRRDEFLEWVADQARGGE